MGLPFHSPVDADIGRLSNAPLFTPAPAITDLVADAASPPPQGIHDDNLTAPGEDPAAGIPPAVAASETGAPPREDDAQSVIAAEPAAAYILDEPQPTEEVCPTALCEAPPETLKEVFEEFFARQTRAQSGADEAGLFGRGLFFYQKWWKLREVEIFVNGDMLTGTPIFTHENTMRVVNELYSYFIPMQKVDYIRTPDGLNSCLEEFEDTIFDR